MFHRFKFFLPCLIVFVFVPFHSSVYAQTGPAMGTTALSNLFCQCTLKNGKTIKISSQEPGGITCGGALIQGKEIKNLADSKQTIYDQCVNADKFTSGSCKCRAKLNSDATIYYTSTPDQTTCATLSAYFKNNNFSETECAWTGIGEEEKKAIIWKPVAPELAINIPGFKGFSTLAPEQESGGRVVYISYLAEYLAALYRFLISIVGIISAVLIMVGGFQWIIAGGNSTQRSSARERIEGALVGLVLAVGSYLVLYIINPDLVQFKSLRIPIIENVALENAEFPVRGETVGVPKALSNTTYDLLFQKFAGCIGMDWRVYKVLAHHESGLNPAAKTKPTLKNPNPTATGLFQVLNGYCEKVLKKVGWNGYCETPGRTNPAVNTAIVTQGHFKMALNSINGMCGSAGANDKLHMLLFNNGSGPGALRKAIKNYGCDTKAWEAHPEIFHAASYANGVKTLQTMRSMGVENLTGPKNDAQCPFNTGAKPSDFPS